MTDRPKQNQFFHLFAKQAGPFAAEFLTIIQLRLLDFLKQSKYWKITLLLKA